MPSVDIVDLNNAVVGSLELADEVFNAPVNEARTILNDYDGSRDWMRKILQVLFWDERWSSEEYVEEHWRASLEPGSRRTSCACWS